MLAPSNPWQVVSASVFIWRRVEPISRLGTVHTRRAIIATVGGGWILTLSASNLGFFKPRFFLKAKAGKSSLSSDDANARQWRRGFASGFVSRIRKIIERYQKWRTAWCDFLIHDAKDHHIIYFDILYESVNRLLLDTYCNIQQALCTLW